MSQLFGLPRKIYKNTDFLYYRMYVYTNRYTNISFQDVFMGFQEMHSWTTLVDFLIINHAILVPGGLSLYS